MYTIINGGIELQKQLTKNFQAIEFACTHCGKLKISNLLVNRLQEFRDLVDTPVHINSGYRCDQHVVEANYNKTSEHNLGNAADIRLDNEHNLYEIFLILIKMFPRVGMYHTQNGRGFIHVDTKKDNLYG